VRALAYLAALVLALPCVVFAIGILALDHVIATRNVFKILYHFLLAFGWGVPAVALALLALLLAALFPQGRLIGAIVLVLLDVAAVGIALFATRPRQPGEVVFLLPAVASAVIAVFLVRAEVRVVRGPAAPPPSRPAMPSAPSS